MKKTMGINNCIKEKWAVLKNAGSGARQKLQWMVLKIIAAVPFAAFTFCGPVYASEVVTQINTLSTFVLNIISAIGVIVTAWGVFEFANGYQSHDGTQQTSGVKRIVSGLIMVAASSLMNMLGVS